MIFLRQTFVNTVTQMSSTNGSTTFANIFDRNRATTWQTNNAGTDATSATLRIVFSTTQTVSNIILMGINLRNFTIHPNTTTSNFTAAISETTNSATSLYYSFNTMTTIKDVVIVANSTQTADQEKQIGELIVTNLLYNFISDRLPSAANYTPRINKKQIIHTMSDGGTALYNIRNKFEADISMAFVPTTTFNSLKTIYDLATPTIFIPFETTTAWGGDIAEVVWPGQFDFMKLSSNNSANGYKGKIILKQTSGGTF